MKRNLLTLALSLLAVSSINALSANAQSCPNAETFGVRPSRPVDSNLQSRIEVTYFSTDDPGAFISEAAGVSRSGSFTKLSTNQFVARVESLQRAGTASVTKRQSATTFLGEMTALNLERELNDASVINASLKTPNSNHLFGLNRETEINVYKGSSMDGDYYRVRVLSWFVNVFAARARKTVDYDANILLKPGQTAVFKLMGDDEIKRGGASRNYIAVTLRSVNPISLASR